MPTVAGIDIGGTKVGWCLGDDTGAVRHAGRLPNDGTAGPEDLLLRCLAAQQRAADEHGLAPAALGVACPGPFLYREGRFLEVPNMPRWHGFPLRDWLRDHAPWPAHAMNDANALVAAECRWGAAQQARVALFLTMSTGMGAGIAIDGVPLQGGRGFAGEIGHLRLSPDGPVGFGKRGSVEGYLSGPGMVQVARAEALRCRQDGTRTALDDGELTPQRLFALHAQGDAGAAAAVASIAARLGQLLAILVDLLDPDVVALGTIGRMHHAALLPRALAAMRREALPASAAAVRVVPSALTDHGNQSALAAALA